MAEAALNETLLSYVHRRSQINTKITQLQNRKAVATAETADLADWKMSKYKDIRTDSKHIWSVSYKDNPNFTYSDYTEIPEYTDEIDYVDCYYKAEIDDMSAWESAIENQITTMSVELQEINAYMDSYKTMLSQNIKNDHNYAEGL